MPGYEARRTCDKRIILYQDLSCVGDALRKWDVRGQGLDRQPSYLLYFVLRVHDHKWCNKGAAGEEDAIGKQQLTWMQLGSSS